MALENEPNFPFNVVKSQNDSYTNIILSARTTDADEVNLPVTVWDGNNEYNFLRTPSFFEVRSFDAADNPSDVGAHSVLVNVVDADFVEHKVVVELDGITPVSIDIPNLIRCNKITVISAGDFETNVGKINVNVVGDEFNIII